MSLYFTLLLASVGVPLLLSFDKRLKFFKRWKYVLPGIIIIAAFYIFFDVIFTKKGIWGFNQQYLSGITIFALPLEEILFFFAIPYASLFLHYSFFEYFPKAKLNSKTSKIIVIILLAISLILSLLNTERTYTFYVFMKVSVALTFSLFDKTEIIRSFFVSFLLILIPFIVVNGILTGTGIDQEVVWYNNEENLGIRFFTIPIEDFAYAFSLILFNLLLIQKLQKASTK